MHRKFSTKRVFQGVVAIFAGAAFGWTWLSGCSQIVEHTPPEGRVAHVEQGLSTGLVISQVYGGGGNSGAPYNNDYVEIFNRGTTSVSLAGLSLQYSSATSVVSAPNVQPLPSATIAPGHYFLVQFDSNLTTDAGTVGVLPTPDYVAVPVADAGYITNFSATAGRIYLVTGTTPVTCGGAAEAGVDATTTRCDETAAGIVDMVGYGTTATDFEGSGPAPAGSNTTAVLRKAAGCTETDSNPSDFLSGTPTPRNSASPATVCSGDGGTTDGGTDGGTDAVSTDSVTADVAVDATDGATTDAVTDATDGATTDAVADAVADTTDGAVADGGTDTATADDTADAATPTDSTPPKDSGSAIDSGRADTNLPSDTVTDDKSGCSCEMPGQNHAPGSASALALVGIAAFLGRRARRTRRIDQ